MKILLLLGISFVTLARAVEPLEPRTVASSPQKTLTVSLHSEVTTMLVFPEPISMIVGAGLSDGTTSGLIQFDHRGNSAVITFRALQNSQPAFAQIISGEVVYFCRLKAEPRPDSVVTIAAPAAKQASAVPVEEVVSQRLVLSGERLHQLVELSRSAAVLRQALPVEYEGYQSSLEVSAPNRAGNFETRIEQIHRFQKSDSLVFFGVITNKGSVPMPIQSSRIRIRVGDRNLCPSWVSSIAKNLNAGESVRVECVIAGDGQGNRLHLSIHNRFSLNLEPLNRYERPNFRSPEISNCDAGWNRPASPGAVLDRL